MDRGAQEAMRNQMGLDLEQAAAGGVLRGRGTAQGEGSSPAADGRSVGGMGSKVCRFTVPGNPVGKSRARSVPLMRGGKPLIGAGGRPVVSHHTPDKTVNYEATVKLAAQQAMRGRPPFAGPCSLVVEALFSVPVSWSRARQARALAGEERPTKKPDGDNILKAVFDGMNGVVWVDDVQAVDFRLIKRYAEIPGVAVVVMELG